MSEQHYDSFYPDSPPPSSVMGNMLLHEYNHNLKPLEDEEAVLLMQLESQRGDDYAQQRLEIVQYYIAKSVEHLNEYAGLNEINAIERA